MYVLYYMFHIISYIAMKHTHTHTHKIQTHANTEHTTLRASTCSTVKSIIYWIILGTCFFLIILFFFGTEMLNYYQPVARQYFLYIEIIIIVFDRRPFCVFVAVSVCVLVSLLPKDSS